MNGYQQEIHDRIIAMPMCREMAPGYIEGAPKTFEFEGKLSDHPADPGKLTNYGISIVYLSEMKDIDPEDGYLLGDQDRDGRITRADILAMTVEEAAKIYWLQWWKHYDYNRVHNGGYSGWKIFDLAINMGSVRSHMLAQQAAGKLVVDGQLGPRSIQRINDIPEPELLGAIRERAAAFYRGIVDRKPEKEVFLKGWLRRAVA